MLLKKIRLLLLVTVFVAADSVNSLSAQATESITKLNQDRVCLIQDDFWRVPPAHQKAAMYGELIVAVVVSGT